MAIARASLLVVAATTLVCGVPTADLNACRILDHALMDYNAVHTAGSLTVLRPTQSVPSNPSPPVLAPVPAQPETESMSVSKAALPLKLPPSGRPSVPEVPPSGGKRGIAYNVPAYTFMFNCPKIGWAYNWGSSRSTGPISDQFMFVPMLWSDHSELTNSWNNNVELAMKTGSDAAMAFNEPDGCIDGGSCMPAPGETAWLYKTLVAPFAGRIRLGSPSVTNGDQAHKGINWFRQFMRACNAIGCPIDFVQVHWFGWCNDLGGFKRHVWEMFEAGGRRPVWVTEYSCNLGDMTPDLPERVEFLTQSLEWLDSQDWIEKYAYFMAREGDGMINSAGTGLSKLGMIYNS